MMVPPAFNSPDFSASSIIARPTLSFIEPPGFCDSSLTKSSQGPVSNAVSFSIGVLPIIDKRDVCIVIIVPLTRLQGPKSVRIGGHNRLAARVSQNINNEPLLYM